MAYEESMQRAESHFDEALANLRRAEKVAEQKHKTAMDAIAASQVAQEEVDEILGQIDGAPAARAEALLAAVRDAVNKSRSAQADAWRSYTEAIEAQVVVTSLSRTVESARAVVEIRRFELHRLFATGNGVMSEPPDGGAEPPEFCTIEIHYGTDRKLMDKPDKVQLYGNQSVGLSLGVCHVSIPMRHKPGRIEKPPWWRKADPRKDIVLLDAMALAEAGFLESLKEELADTSSKQVLVFIHGFNVTFEEAAQRTAQLTYDLGFDGAAAMYSWPSRGNTDDYFVDRQTATDHSPEHLAAFLKLIADRSGATKIHIIAHSMGNEVLCRATEKLQQEFGPGQGPEFGHIVMAAPDIWRKTFLEKFAGLLVGRGESVTLYASSHDLALNTSQEIHDDEPRAGSSKDGITIFPGIDTVVADEFKRGLLYHSYYAEVESIIYDLIASIRLGFDPTQRCLRHESAAANQRFWSCVKKPDAECLEALLAAIADIDSD